MKDQEGMLKKGKWIGAASIVVAGFLAAFFYTSSNAALDSVTDGALPSQVSVANTGKRSLLDSEFRGIYISSWTAGINRFYKLVDMAVQSQQLNGVVIDVKDSTGRVGYDSKVPMVAQIGSYERRIKDLDKILAYCREKKIHTVARIAVFQDPHLATARPDLAVQSKAGGNWSDRKGLMWVDPASREVWEYNIAIAKEAAARGFDEVQFDYVRFPTDGAMQLLSYPLYKGDVPKHEIIRRFFEYVDVQMKPVDVLTSADVFGLTVMAEDDLQIGQRLEDIAPYVDYVCPMIYPSHFPRGHLGLKNPGEHPYVIIYDSCMWGMKKLEGKRAKMRPWLQDFKIGGAYDKKMIMDQIQAARDAKAFGFTMWNARNVYTESAFAEKLPDANPTPPLYNEVMARIQKTEQAQAQKKLLKAQKNAKKSEIAKLVKPQKPVQELQREKDAPKTVPELPAANTIEQPNPAISQGDIPVKQQ